MTKRELRDFMAARKPSPHIERRGAEGLACYGCAHSSAIDGPPGSPSGERPCCSCVRNPGREDEAAKAREARPDVDESNVKIDSQGHAHIFDAFAGTMYNGAPRLYFPMDNYVTLDQRDQEEWLDQHSEYKKAITFGHFGSPIRVVDE